MWIKKKRSYLHITWATTRSNTCLQDLTLGILASTSHGRIDKRGTPFWLLARGMQLTNEPLYIIVAHLKKTEKWASW